VHAGFYAAWRTGNFHARVLDRVAQIFHSPEVMGMGMRILVTGHSLGGALASLAALEIKNENPGARVGSYTYGSPRVGNKLFSDMYNAVVPDTFKLATKEDPIPHQPKVTYKRCGQRVALTLTGDVVVNPTYFELSVLSSTTGSMKAHRTGAYGLALALFIKAQYFAVSRVPGGEQGATDLARTVDLERTLLMENMSLGALKNGNVRPVPLVERREGSGVMTGVGSETGSGGGLIQEKEDGQVSGAGGEGLIVETRS
jgi:hypothetical protein